MLCRACSRRGSCRLGLEVESLETDGSVRTQLVCDEEHEGGPGVAHGGWTAAVLDELVGHVPLLHGQLAVTGSLSVRFVRPIPVRAPLLGSAAVTKREGSRWHVEAQLLLIGTDAVLAIGEGVLVERDPGHFARFQSWLGEQSGG